MAGRQSRFALVVTILLAFPWYGFLPLFLLWDVFDSPLFAGYLAKLALFGLPVSYAFLIWTFVQYFRGKRTLLEKVFLVSAALSVAGATAYQIGGWLGWY